MGADGIRAVVIDDHPVFRHGLAHAIEAAGDFTLVAAEAGVEACAAEDLQDVDLVVLDLGLPGMHGAAAVEFVAQLGPRVLVVSAAAGESEVLEAMRAGASGYLTKAAEPEEIVAASRIIAAGGTYVSPTLAAFLLRSTAAGNEADRLALSDREREVLTLVAQGERDVDIAARLHLSVKTVRSHLDRIRDKTGRRRRADLTRLALESGLLGGDDSDRR